MIQGTSSWAGKSLLATALARIFADRGHDVAPFKSLNMSNNARVAEGGEIGAAQYLQALAARKQPDVLMNPVLIKPEADTRSQVVVLGKHDPELSATPWQERAEHLRAVIDSSLDTLLERHELIVAEGAGSPAEINLKPIDLANMYVAERADAAVLIAADINRGGAFAHLYGTWALLDEAERARVKGFILNRFRGESELLAPGPEQLEQLTGVPVLGVVPWLAHRLPDEDGVAPPQSAPADAPRVAIVRYPAASNLDEFKPLEQVAQVQYAVTPSEIGDAELVVLPGSKHIGSDLAWLRETRFDRALAVRIASGRRVLAICGGLQMLGSAIEDPAELEAASGAGLGFLPVTTTLASDKRTNRRSATFAALPDPWSELSGLVLDGYEIRHGRTESAPELDAALPDDLGWVSGPLLGIYLHGAFENPLVVDALLGITTSDSGEDAIAELARSVAAHLDVERIAALVAP